MQDELLLEQTVDEMVDIALEETQVSIEEDIIETQTEVVQTYVDVKEAEEVEISVSEGFTGNTSLNVAADHSRYLPDQHTIGAITGLREELDEIERLKTVYADEKNQANYYLWEDENPAYQNRNGYFVAARKDDSRIHICTSDEDEFGVTVSSAGLIGGQSVVAKDDRYGLVVHSGLVGVRCETDVISGDYVVSDDYGVAKKTDGTYGYLVTAISKINGDNYAIISLTMPSTQMQKFSKTTQDVANRMKNAEINIATAISVANAAYNKAQSTEESVNNNNTIVGDQIGDIIDRVEDMEGQVGEFGNALGSVSQVAAQAYGISNAAASTAENIRREAVEVANDAQASVNNLIADLAPVTTWNTVDAEGNPVVGAQYFIEHVNNDLATKTEVEAVETLTEQNKTAITKNAENIEMFATSIDKYSVGEWSQAYGLTWEQAKSILKKNMLYIPTVEHDEAYEGYPTNDGRQEFTRGYYYIWNGSYWVESVAPLVYFSSEYVYPSEQCEYWYRETDQDLIRPDDVTGDMVTYDAHALYILMNDKWTKVNILDGNVTNRIVSAIRQTANQISIDVINAKGDIAALEAKVDSGGATTAMMASVVTHFKDSEGNQINITGNPHVSVDDIVATSGEYYAVGDSAPYDIYTLMNGKLTKINYLYYDGVEIKQPNTASIVAAVNSEGDESIGINADKIIMTGTTTFLTPLDVGPNGSTIINGGRVQTGAIQSHDYVIGVKGFQIDLTNNTIWSPNFQLDQYGNVNMVGKITAMSGDIAGFEINSIYNWYYYDGLNSGEEYYFILNDVKYYFVAPEVEPDNVLVLTTYDSEDTLLLSSDNYLLTDNEESSLSVLKTTTLTLIYGDTEIVCTNREDIPSGTQLITLTQGRSYISKGQSILAPTFDENDSVFGSAGVYISPDGIGLGNGNFVIDNSGNLTTYGNITMNSIIDDKSQTIVSISDGDLSLAGNIAMGGNITMGGTISMNDEDGNELLSLSNGSITLSGNITWGANSSPVQVKYSVDGDGTPVTNPDDWHDGYDSANDYYASYSYDGGKTWTNAVAIRGQKGDTGATGPRGPQGPTGPQGEDANLADYGIIDPSRTQINSTNIYSPLLLGRFGVANIDSHTVTGYMGYAEGDTFTTIDGEIVGSITTGIAISRFNGAVNANTTWNPHLVVTQGGVRMSHNNNSIFVCASGAYFVQNGGTPQLIGSGGGSGGTAVAVFG